MKKYTFEKLDLNKFLTDMDNIVRFKDIIFDENIDVDFRNDLLSQINNAYNLIANREDSGHISIGMKYILFLMLENEGIESLKITKEEEILILQTTIFKKEEINQMLAWSLDVISDEEKSQENGSIYKLMIPFLWLSYNFKKVKKIFNV